MQQRGLAWLINEQMGRGSRGRAACRPAAVCIVLLLPFLMGKYREMDSRWAWSNQDEALECGYGSCA